MAFPSSVPFYNVARIYKSFLRVLCISSVSLIFMNYLNNIHTTYSQNSTFTLSSYNASRFCTRHDVDLYYISNGISVVLSGSSIENFDSQNPKDRKVVVFVTLAPVYSVLLGTNVSQFSWFQTFAVFWIQMYVFFWVFPRRLMKIAVCRRFGTIYQFHLQRPWWKLQYTDVSEHSISSIFKDLWRWNW